MSFKRQCPTCGSELVYANLPGFQRAARTKALCRKCAASPAIIEKRIDEAEQRRSERKPEGNFMAGFFEMIDQSLSGSVGRK